MVISRRKRKENKEITVYMNNKPLEQVQKIKYLRIIIDSKLNLREHIIHTASKCRKLIMPYQVCKTQLGAKPRSIVHRIQSSNSTTIVVRCAGMDRGTGEEMQQNSIQQSTAPY